MGSSVRMTDSTARSKARRLPRDDRQNESGQQMWRGESTLRYERYLGDEKQEAQGQFEVDEEEGKVTSDPLGFWHSSQGVKAPSWRPRRKSRLVAGAGDSRKMQLPPLRVGLTSL